MSSNNSRGIQYNIYCHCKNDNGKQCCFNLLRNGMKWQWSSLLAVLSVIPACVSRRNDPMCSSMRAGPLDADVSNKKKHSIRDVLLSSSGRKTWEGTWS